MSRLSLSTTQLAETFHHFRSCGAGRRECQALWVSPWAHPEGITRVVHPQHHAHGAGFELESNWLHAFWLNLAAAGLGIRVQIHTHPGRAYHSPTDDAFPIIHTPGFLSLVIPDFATGPVSLDNAYLAEISPSGQWRAVEPTDLIEIVP